MKKILLSIGFLATVMLAASCSNEPKQNTETSARTIQTSTTETAPTSTLETTESNSIETASVDSTTQESTAQGVSQASDLIPVTDTNWNADRYDEKTGITYRINQNKGMRDTIKLYSVISTDGQNTGTLWVEPDGTTAVEWDFQISNKSQNTTEISTEPLAGNQGVTIFRATYYFDGFNGTLAETDKPAYMSEHFTRSYVTVTDDTGTWEAELYTYHDGTAQIMKPGFATPDMTGTWKRAS